VTQWVFLPARSFQVADLVSNTLGVVLGYLIVIRLARRR